MNRTDSVTYNGSTAILPRGGSDRVRAVLALFALLLWTTQGDAQPPATYPPADLLRPLVTPPESGKLPIEGMLFLDVTEVPIYIPRMTYEKYLELERGGKNQSRRYVFESVTMDGQVEGNRAELTVEVRVAVDATSDGTVEIPLAMENFHRLGPVEFFSGAEQGNKLAVAVNQETGDHQLLASVVKDTIVGFRMQMSARVETDAMHSLDFRLPPSPIVINLISDSRDVVGQIPNRDDEVIETTTDSLGRSRFKVESSGGRFSLQWGKLDRPVSAPLLEATSGISMQWNSPQDQLIQNVKMTVRDSRGPISSFPLRLPVGATLRDEPKLITSGQFGQQVEISTPDTNDPGLLMITIPKFERRQSIVLEFRIEIPSDSPSASKALPFQVPVVEGALSNRGTITITTGSDYRLRWRQRLYINNTTSAADEEKTVDQRSYSFEFIRGAFTLPLWLDATKQELRVSSVCDIVMQDNYANLAMDIRSIGNGNRTQLLSVDLADWQAPRVENARTGAPLPWYESDGMIEIEVSYTGMEESIPVMIKTRRLIDASTRTEAEPQIQFAIPRVVGSGDRRDPITIQEAEVRLSGKGRRSFVVDMERSTNLERADDLELVANSERTTASERVGMDDIRSEDFVRVFSVMPPESAARMVGEMVVRPPRISMEDNATVKLIGDQLVTTVVWQIETPVDLEGRLRIAIPLPNEEPAEVSSVGNAEGERVDLAAAMKSSEWSVEVNNRAAQLMAVGTAGSLSTEINEAAASTDAILGVADSLEYELVSDSLSSGAMEIRFVHAETVPFDVETLEAYVTIGLPYPLVQDVTLKGMVEVEFLGGETHDITLSGKSLTDQVVFRTLPTQTIPLRISPRAPEKSELSAQQIFVRTAINEISQHDQLLAMLSGSGEFELQLRYPGLTDVQVSMDGAPAAFKLLDQRLVVRIPTDAEQHMIDVRLWVDQSRPGLFQSIEPLAHVGPGAGQLYWQLTVPADCHLVWATPSVAREMRWGFDRWRMTRTPLMTETALVSRLSSNGPDLISLSPMPKGNPYLFSSMDDRSFRVISGSRTLLWMVVAGSLVLVTALLTYIPVTRSPLSAAVAVAGFSGLLAVAPDAAILVGQVTMLALVLVVVMLSIRQLVLPNRSRVLSSTQDRRLETSNLSRRQQPEYRPPSSIAVTHSIGPEDIAANSGEVAS